MATHASWRGATPLDCRSGVQQSPFLPVSTCDPRQHDEHRVRRARVAESEQDDYPRDRNNFGPAIGFAWQVPWFGEGKTTVRGGYQVTVPARSSQREDTLAPACRRPIR